MVSVVSTGIFRLQMTAGDVSHITEELGFQGRNQDLNFS